MRYSRNMKMLSPKENDRLKEFKVLVVGCGGLGGYIIEMLARLGFGHIVVADGDVFDGTNLNRQLLSKESLIGFSKAEAAKGRVFEINSEVTVSVVDYILDSTNITGASKGCMLIFDAVDNVEAKLMLQDSAEKLNIPLIHGAIGGWFGQVSTILPGERTLSKIYRTSQNTIEKELGNPSFTPGLIASVQVAEGLKVLLNKGEILSGKILFIDLLSHDFEVVDFK